MEQKYLNENTVYLKNGNDGLSLALLDLQLNEGDEVMLPTQIDISLILPILYLKLKPVFIDIDYRTGNIDDTLVEPNVTEKIKAILISDWAGYPCNLDEFKRVSVKYKIPIIHDKTYSIGSEYKGIKDYSIAKYEIISLDLLNLPDYTGGMLKCNNSETYDNVLKLIFDREGKKNSLNELSKKWYSLPYDFKRNEREINQLKTFEEKWTNIGQFVDELTKKLNDELKDVDNITLFNYVQNRKSRNSFFGFHVHTKRNLLLGKIKNSSIGVINMGVDKHPILKQDNQYINQRKFDGSQLHINLLNTNLEDVSQIINDLKSGW